jgi:hypothetical protein
MVYHQMQSILNSSVSIVHNMQLGAIYEWVNKYKHLY